MNKGIGLEIRDSGNNYNNTHPVTVLAECYPQLLLPLKPGMRGTEEYKNAVLRGIFPKNTPDFSMNPKDCLTSFHTPAGSVDIFFLEDRADFEHAVRALANRCEPVEIPASMGASYISGLINWKKIHNHMEVYRENGGNNEDREFAEFTSDKSHYIDSLILLSSGDYSGVPASDLGIDPADWREKSVTIRQYHELTHFYCRKKYPENKDAIRDEVLADLIGLTAAFSVYEPDKALRIFGIEGDTCRPDGRLRNYVEKENLDVALRRTSNLIRQFSEAVAALESRDLYSVIDFLEINKIGSVQINPDAV